MCRPIDNLENGMVLGNTAEPRLSQIDWENQDDERDTEWFEENMRGEEDE